MTANDDFKEGRMVKRIDYTDYEQIDPLPLQKEGHTFHCAMRILTGDGECECNLKNYIPGLISRQMYKGVCPVCLMKIGHKDWCRNKEAQ